MKKIILIILLIIILQILSAIDFRDCNWGFSMRKVRQTEKAEFFAETEEFLVYRDSVATFEATVIYYFIDDSLVEGIYLIQPEYFLFNDYIYDFFTLRELLIRKYDEPLEDTDVSEYMLKEDLDNKIGRAIAKGEKSLQCKWRLEKSFLALTLDSTDFKMEIRILYMDNNFVDEILRIQDEKELKGL